MYYKRPVSLYLQFIVPYALKSIVTCNDEEAPTDF